MSNRHIPIDVVIDGEVCKIDEEMVCIVRWLNGFDSVKTYMCCQGMPRYNGYSYCSFFCTDNDDLKSILKVLHDFLEDCKNVLQTWKISLKIMLDDLDNVEDNEWCTFQYWLDLDNTIAVKAFTEYLIENKHLITTKIQTA